MGSYFFLQVLVVVFALSILTTTFNKRILGLPSAISVLLSGVVCGLGLPSVMNAFYYNPNEPKEGFAGWYQRLCHKMNRKGFKYTVASGPCQYL